MANEELLDKLRNLLKDARLGKERAYEAYTEASSDNRWKLKLTWQNACAYVRELSVAIRVIERLNP